MSRVYLVIKMFVSVRRAATLRRDIRPLAASGSDGPRTAPRLSLLSQQQAPSVAAFFDSFPP
jgi:hypothetical protein